MAGQLTRAAQAEVRNLRWITRAHQTTGPGNCQALVFKNLLLSIKETLISLKDRNGYSPSCDFISLSKSS